jgi:hypothetical protein
MVAGVDSRAKALALSDIHWPPQALGQTMGAAKVTSVTTTAGAGAELA